MKILVVVILILLLVIVVTVTYLLVSPIKLIVDSPNQTCLMKWGRFINARLADENNNWGVRIKAPLWSKYYSLQEIMYNRKKEKSRTNTKSKVKTKAVNNKLDFKRIARILRQIKIRRFTLSIDTTDVIYNAYLIPIFELIRYRTGYQTQINYLGINRIVLNAESRMINLIIAGFIK